MSAAAIPSDLLVERELSRKLCRRLVAAKTAELLGVFIDEMLAGRPLLNAQRVLELVAEHEHHERHALQKLERRDPGARQEIIGNALLRLCEPAMSLAALQLGAVSPLLGTPVNEWLSDSTDAFDLAKRALNTARISYARALKRDRAALKLGSDLAESLPAPHDPAQAVEAIEAAELAASTMTEAERQATFALATGSSIETASFETGLTEYRVKQMAKHNAVLAAEFTRPRVASGHTAPRGGSDEFRSEPAPIDVTLTAKFSAPIRGLREEVRSWRNAYFDGLKPPPAYRPKDPVEWRKIEIAERPADERASSGRLFGQV